MQKQPELNLIEGPVGPLEVATLGIASEMISFPQGLLLFILTHCMAGRWRTKL